MSSNRWVGNAVATAQVRAATITAYDAATTYKLTIGNYSVSTLGTGGTVTTTAAALIALANATTAPGPFLEITWTQNSGTVIGTANTAGKAFTFTSSASGGTGTFGSAADTTANSGPNDVNVTGNWSLGALPTAADDVYIDASDVSLLYNLDALASVALTSLTVGKNFTGYIGLPKTNTDGSTAYAEYRADYFQIQATTVNIGTGDGTGSGRIKIDNRSGTATTVNVYDTGSSVDTGLEAFLWKGTNASNVMNVMAGTVGIAPFPGETATVSTLGIAGGTVRATSGVTLTTVNKTGGSLSAKCAATTINARGQDGSVTLRGEGAYTSILLDEAASLIYQSSGTITTLKVGPSCSADFSQDSRSRTITNLVELHAGSTFNDPMGKVTLTAGFQTTRCDLSQVTASFGPNRSFTVI